MRWFCLPLLLLLSVARAGDVVNPGAGSIGIGIDNPTTSGTAISMNFATATYTGGCTPATCLAVVRASTGYCSDNTGLFISFSANLPRICAGNGFLIEAARTNDALFARDMTNAAWVKTTMTTALNAVGIDGNANSATTLTATGALAMSVQTITLASQADNYSVYLKRVTGSGTISLCLAATACGTATPCTVTSTVVFVRCTVTATVLNPIVGIQISTNGDAVIADFNQMEPGSTATSPILTTAAAATRASDLVTLTGVAKTTVQSSSFYAVIYVAGNAGILSGTGMLETNIDELLQIRTPSTLRSVFGVTNLDATLGSGSFTTTLVKSAIGVAPGARSLVANNGTVVTDATNISADTSFFLGSFGNGAGFPNAYFVQMNLGTPKPSDATLQGFTQ
jgi:hypothetical protein